MVADKRVTVCLKCADKIRSITDESVRDTRYDYFVEALAHGRREVIINDKPGGAFGLSTAAQIQYCNRLGIHYLIRPREDRHNNEKFGAYVEVDGNYDWWLHMPRDDATLVSVVKDIKEAANGYNSSLKIVVIPADVDWQIFGSGGDEWVAERHRIWY